MSDVSERQLEILRHMLGAPRKRRRGLLAGYRNGYCAGARDADADQLWLMADAGLVVSGRSINYGTDQYFHATAKGCEAIGLSKAATKRALKGKWSDE